MENYTLKNSKLFIYSLLIIAFIVLIFLNEVLVGWIAQSTNANNVSVQIPWEGQKWLNVHYANKSAAEKMDIYLPN